MLWGWWFVSQDTERPDAVVVTVPGFGEDLSLFQRREDFSAWQGRAQEQDPI
jgi:hypothetical protein